MRGRAARGLPASGAQQGLGPRLVGHDLARERGRGVATALVDAAVALAFERGAREIEAYPQVVQAGQRQAGAFVWTRVPALYERVGFTAPLPRDKGRVLYLLPAPASD